MTLKVGNGLDLQSRPIVGLPIPTNDNEAANKAYVDGVVRGLSWKEEVRAASTGNLTLSGTQTVDGVVLVAGDRVLAKDQSTTSQNGIYVVAAGAWARALDADSATELSGATTTVQAGTVNAERVYRVITDDPITLGTTAIAFAQVGAGTSGEIVDAGDGLVKNATTLSVGAGTGITVTADAVAIDTSIVARKMSTVIGNGAATSFAVAHNLGTRDITVQVYNATTFEEVLTDTVRTDLNTVTVLFATAPTNGQYRVVVTG